MTTEDQKWLDEHCAPSGRGVWKDRQPNQPILEFLTDERIIHIAGMTSDRREVVIEEACDNYFSVTFNKAQLSEFISALQALHDQMRE